MLGWPPVELGGAQGADGVLEALLIAFPAFEDGCQVLTLSEISIRVLPELRLTRRKNEVGTSLLHEVT